MFVADNLLDLDNVNHDVKANLAGEDFAFYL